MWGLVLALLIAISIAGFASLNGTPVSVNFYFWRAPEVSLALVVLFSALIGVITAALFGTPQYLKTIKKIKELEKKTKDMPGGEIENEKKKEQSPPQN
ncbi:MAG: LapA family protein [Candidatus Margulisiibacteriota bacterium]